MTASWCARAVRATNVRCWERLSVDLAPGVILVWGPNGAGKTSLIEAIAMGCVGSSPRTSREAELVRSGAEAAHVELEIDGPGGSQLRSIGYQPRRGRRLAIDGSGVRSLAEWSEPGAALIFLPDELRIIKGPPAARRRHLDRLLDAAVAGYRGIAADYRHAVSQRNALLRRVRSGEASAGELDPWERQLVPLAGQIMRARRAAMRDLHEPFSDWLAALGGGPCGRLELEPSPAAMAEVADDDLEQAFAQAFAARRPRDIGAAQTLSGPHREDVAVFAGSLDLRHSGSQGEQRTAALALTLAHRDLLATRRARPILLLDDALSELDPQRRERVLAAVGHGGQAIITTADPAAADDARALSAQVLEVSYGTVRVE